ncbi:hypothetical protein HDU92_007074 [Lobulomyces angularis]|nr:hypothetical protein HDU92_007074 [Lobulomyces angularis]
METRTDIAFPGLTMGALLLSKIQKSFRKRYNFRKVSRSYHRKNTITDEQRETEPREFVNENFLRDYPKLMSKIQRKNNLKSSFLSNPKKSEKKTLNNYNTNIDLPGLVNDVISIPSDDEISDFKLKSPTPSTNDSTCYSRQSPASSLDYLTLRPTYFNDQDFQDAVYLTVFSNKAKEETTRKSDINYLLAPIKPSGDALQRYSAVYHYLFIFF